MATRTKGKSTLKTAGVRTGNLLENYVSNYHERIFRDNLAKMVDNLEHDHPVRVLLGELKNIHRALALLESTKQKFQQCNKFECVTVGQWQLLVRSVESFKKIDELFHAEEALLFPELIEHGFSGEIRQIMAEHNKVHQLVDRLVAAYDGGISDNYHRINATISAISLNLAKRIRLLIHRESHILYPRVLRVVSGTNSWRRMKEIADKLHLRLGDAY